jgi:hypothetical protein
MGYSFNRFLKPIAESDKTIKIYDDRNYPVHTINPFSVLRLYVNSNNLVIVLSGNTIIVLDFPDSGESQEGLIKLQLYVDTIKQSTTTIITPTDPIDQAILSSGIGSFNGSTASNQKISITNDDNIELDINITSDNSINAIHNLSIQWTGILPMERGGLNNTYFKPNEILISNFNSVVSSGYYFNDLGTTAKDIWSADKILKSISTNTVNKEIPTGSINSINKIFILTFEPLKGSEHVYLNGLLQDGDPNSDYTIVGNKITFSEAPFSGSKIRCTYTPKKGSLKYS